MLYVHELIEVNLNLIFLSENKSLPFSQFKDKNGNKFPEYLEFLKIMESQNLIEVTSRNGSNTCSLTPFGQEICENGGWIHHLNRIENEILEQKKRLVNKRAKWLSLTNFLKKAPKNSLQL